MNKSKENKYYVLELEHNGLTKQLDWSNNLLNDDNEVHKANYALYQGQIVHYLHYDLKAEKFVRSTALCLEDSDEYSNSAVICPLIEAIKLKDYKLGINVGTIIGKASQYDHIALIPAIHSISKDYIIPDDIYEINVFTESTINNIIDSYRNFLKSLILKNTKKRAANIS